MKLKQNFTGVILTAKLLFSEGNEPLVLGGGETRWSGEIFSGMGE